MYSGGGGGGYYGFVVVIPPQPRPHTLYRSHDNLQIGGGGGGGLRPTERE